ncbi:nucleoside hydrolase [Dokdonella koreensis]|uniref:Inosine-uridine nucleoside N-ribohydrolase n=1 Tax=Dokdonella koreensis DS-123 TaxID=1300342 RepID=A0A160DXH7_9GAMM|nr:nucleoside hydrolase [Dokdonella koreensis]ANB18673.1 Inosine-uridine nucleoside N-ribohydrolase [Dokdonella koreensis DS-123]
MIPDLLIDTDPGVDDALAILMAHHHARVHGLTIAAGNVGLGHTVRNALKLVDLLQADTPVFPGCPVPLVLPAADAAFVHGLDGFGDTGYAPAARAPEAEHAALALVRLARRQPGRLTLVALGPLTNLALALRLDPDLPRHVQRLVVMGGAVTGTGNTERLPAEFNIGFDPEAAHVVFTEWPRFDLVDWEATQRHAIALDRFERVLAAGDRRARFYAALSRKTRDFSQARGRRGLMAADALAMAVALQPDIVSDAAERRVEVELTGALTRGATLVDWQARSGRPANARIVLEVDQARFEALIAAALGA